MFHRLYIFVQALANLLYEAAEECGYVNPKKVEEILGVTREEAAPRFKRIKLSESETGEGAYQCQSEKQNNQ